MYSCIGKKAHEYDLIGESRRTIKNRVGVCHIVCILEIRIPVFDRLNSIHCSGDAVKVTNRMFYFMLPPRYKHREFSLDIAILFYVFCFNSKSTASTMPVAQHPQQTTETKRPKEASPRSDRHVLEDADYCLLFAFNYSSWCSLFWWIPRLLLHRITQLLPQRCRKSTNLLLRTPSLLNMCAFFGS